MDCRYLDTLKEKLQQDFTDFVGIYENQQEDMIGIQFADVEIELSRHYVENAYAEVVLNIVTAFLERDNALHIPVMTQNGFHINHRVTSSFGSQSIDDQVMKEQKAAQHYINKAQIAADEAMQCIELTAPLTLKQAKCLFALTADFELERQQNHDELTTNKQGEQVFIRKIYNEEAEDNIGWIKYLEDDASITVLHSFIEKAYRNKGLATQAYSTLIDDKIKQGKAVYSDNIVSSAAEKIYQKLAEKGYSVITHPARLKPRSGLTTLSAENIRRQQSHFPTQYCEGALVTEEGYRLKGTHVFSVIKSPNVQYDRTPITLIIRPFATPDEVTFKVEPKKITLTSPIQPDIFMLPSATQQDITLYLDYAKKELVHSSNQDLRKGLEVVKIEPFSRTTVTQKALYNAMYPPRKVDLQANSQTPDPTY